MQGLFLVVTFACFTVPFALVGLWWWFWMFVAIGGVVGAFEAVAVWRTGRTVSQMFWDWSKEHRGGAWAVVGSLVLGWGLLMLHLVWKII